MNRTDTASLRRIALAAGAIAIFSVLIGGITFAQGSSEPTAEPTPSAEDRITAVEGRLAAVEAKIGTLSTAVGILQDTPAGESFAAGTYTATVTCPEDWDGYGAPSGHLLAGPRRMFVYPSETFTLYTRTTLVPVDVDTGCEMSIVRI